MHIKVNVHQLAEAIIKAGAFVPAKASLNILKMVKLQTKGGSHLSIQGTDLTIAIDWTLRAEIIEEGAICISHTKLGRFLRLLSKLGKDEQIEITIKSYYSWTFAVLSSPSGAFFDMEIIAEKAEEYPSLPEEQGKIMEMLLTSKGLAQMAHSLVPASAEDGTRPVLQCLMMRLKGDGSSDACTTDGFRLHTLDTSADIGHSIHGHDELFLLPARFVKLAAAIARSDAASPGGSWPSHLRIAYRAVRKQRYTKHLTGSKIYQWQPTLISLILKDCIIYSHPTIGSAPARIYDIEEIGRENASSFDIDPQIFLSACKQGELVGDALRLRLNADESFRIEPISVYGIETTKSLSWEIPISNMQGGATMVAFNIDYVADAIKALGKAASIRVRVPHADLNPERPDMSINPDGSLVLTNGQAIRALIMPLSVR